MIAPVRFTEADATRAAEEWGANCGPAALAAMTGRTLDEVRPHLRDFEARGYTNPTLMHAALTSLGVEWRKIGPELPTFGLIRIQWLGPWMEPKVPRRARYRYTHWIGSTVERGERGVFDVNALNNGTGWVSFEEWQAVLAPYLWASYKRATGWAVADGVGDVLEIER